MTIKKLTTKCAQVDKARTKYEQLVDERDEMILDLRGKGAPWNDLIEATGLGRANLLRVRRKALAEGKHV